MTAPERPENDRGSEKHGRMRRAREVLRRNRGRTIVVSTILGLTAALAVGGLLRRRAGTKGAVNSAHGG